MPSCYIANYNDANGTLGYPVSGTAGIYIVLVSYVIVFAYYGNGKVFITIDHDEPISNIVKIV